MKQTVLCLGVRRVRLHIQDNAVLRTKNGVDPECDFTPPLEIASHAFVQVATTIMPT